MELLYTAHVPAGDGPFPTIFLLHGWGASAHDLIGLAPILHGGRALVLCPQGPVAIEPGPNMIGYGWFPLAPGQPPDPTAVRMAQGLVEIFIEDACAKYPVDPTKVVLAGFSQGGFMALPGGARRSRALCRPARDVVVAARRARGRDRAQARPRGAPGARDPRIEGPDGADRARLRLARRAARLQVPTVFREYEMAHEIRPEALREIVGWLEQKVLSPVSLAR
jgi:phospholipase/carboxylesterase